MIKIDQTNSRKDNKKKIKSKKESLHIKDKEDSFNINLENSILFNFQATFDVLLDDLKEVERTFLASQSFYELNRYKALVKKILKTILKEGFQVRILRRLRKDRADFQIVEQINSKLVEISLEITKKNNKAFKLFKSIEEIRGLLVDLVY